MITPLPDERRWRRPTLDDAEAIYEFVAEQNTRAIGFADVTLDDIRDEFAEPEFEPDRDGWIVEDELEQTVGYGVVYRRGTSDMVDVDVYASEDEVADWLWAHLSERAAEIGAENGHDTVRVGTGVYENDVVARERAVARGFEPATSFKRMRIDFDQPPADVAVPDGVVVQVGPGDETFRRDAHRVSTRAFVDHFGFVAKSFEEWHEGIESSATHDWGQLRVAYVDGRSMAMARGSDQFAADEDCGYVATVAVLPEARGRGLAKLLLRQRFVDDARRGRRGTILHVDANNTTPALDLYLDVGMRPVLSIDIWRVELPTTR